MTPAELRGRIETALRARHATDDVNIETTRRHFGVPAWGVGADCGDVRHLVAGESATELDALASLAVAVGLDADGTDPRAENERLRAVLAVAQSSLAAAVRDERVTVVDEVARLTRERDAAVARANAAVTEAGALRAAAREYIDAVADIERAVTGPRTGAAIDSAAMIARRNAARVALAAIAGGKP